MNADDNYCCDMMKIQIKGRIMAQLFFEYGTMNSGKTLEILKVAYNYEAQGREVLILSPMVDDRDGVSIIHSRNGQERKAQVISESENLFDVVKNKKIQPAVVLVDEAQFIAPEQVDQLAQVVDELDIPVMTFGLRQDAFNQLFPGSKRLFEIADKLEETKTICTFCGKKAVMNMRVVNGVPQRTGDQVMIGGDDLYIPTCRIHWHNPVQEKIDEMFK